MNRFAVALVLVAGCQVGGGKDRVDEDFGELAGAKAAGKTDGIDPMVVGSIEYGQSIDLHYHFGPRYRLVKFPGHAGDHIDVRVTSATGDALAWVLDDSFHVLGFDDDAAADTLDAAIHLTLPDHPSITHYVVVRDYWFDDADFTVALDGENDLTSCQHDADCVLAEVGCCAVGDWTAVRADQLGAFEAAKSCQAGQICPLRPIQFKGEQALCNNDSHTCEVVLPDDVDCGGRSLNPHGCPDRFQCMGPNLPVDGTGACVQACGGFGNFGCLGDKNCVDDPTDDCDPQGGGADCGGICVDGDAARCDVVGCPGGGTCQLCFGSLLCMPDGTMC